MSNQKTETIYLLSSNASKKYIINAFETLAVPPGTIQHHRYQLMWVDPKLRANLPRLAESSASRFTGHEVVACYLFQEQNKKKKWQWTKVYPLRSGILMDAYKTGDTDDDVAHFYFRVAGYYEYRKDNTNLSSSLNSAVLKALGDGAGKYYASLGNEFERKTANPTDEESAFHAFAETLDTKHLLTPDLGGQYLPALCFIRGLYEIKPGDPRVDPGYDNASHESFYEIREGVRYTFEFSFHFPRSSTPDDGSTIALVYDTKLFASAAENIVNVNSRYDEKAWLVLPGTVDADIWSSLRFQTEIKAGGMDVLNLARSFSVLIKPRVLRRRLLSAVDITGDVGLAVGTVGMTLLTTVKPDFAPTLVIVGFAFWGLSKIISIFLPKIR